jgi:hypothetical protein
MRSRHHHQVTVLHGRQCCSPRRRRQPSSAFRPNNTALGKPPEALRVQRQGWCSTSQSASDGGQSLEDPLAPAQCQVGRLRVELDGYWDAANEIPSAAESGSGIRKLLVSAYTTAPQSTLPATPATFNTTTITAALLGITETSTALTTLIATYACRGHVGDHDGREPGRRHRALRRGCVFSSSTTCTDRGDNISCGTSSTQIRWWWARQTPACGSSPTRVPSARPPQAGDLRQLERRLLHGFNTGEWDTTLDPDGYNRGTGAEQFGFMTYPARQKIDKLPIQVTPKLVTMDGSPNAADVWFYPTATSVAGDETPWATWHTVLLSGMREGGRVVFALDVTNPPDTANPSGVSGGPIYPGYLWEFPCESSDQHATAQAPAAAYSAYMGETWSEPIITRVKVRVNCDDPAPPGAPCARYDRWVAIFGAGYDPNGDPNLAHSATPSSTQYDSSDASTTNREGRALHGRHQVGKVLGMKRYDTPALLGVPNALRVRRHARRLRPGLRRLRRRGLCGDLGGNLWKWVISRRARPDQRTATSRSRAGR